MVAKAGYLEAALLAMAALVIGAAAIFTYWNVVQDREVTRLASVTLTDALAASLEEHVNASLRDAENAANAAAVLIERNGGFKRFGARKLHEELKRELSDKLSTARLVVADSTGRVIASSAEYPVADVSLADSEYFNRHALHPAQRGYHIGTPYRSAIGGELVIPFSRAISGPGKQPVGIIVAELRVDHFDELYREITSRNQASIAVFTREGYLLIRSPYRHGDSGRRILPTAMQLQKMLQGNGNMEFHSPDDGKTRLTSYRMVKRHPLVVAVGLDKEHVLAPWRARMQQRVAVIAVGLAAFCALVVLAISYLRRLASSEARLRESESRFRSAMEHSAIGMALASPEGRWLEVNRALCAIIGYSRDELLALDHEALTHPEHRDVRRDRLRDFSDGRIESFQSEKRFRHKDGHFVWVQVTTSLARDASGAPLHLIVQVQDITERRQAEEAIRQLNAELETRVAERTAELLQVNKDLEAFSYSVAHDLRGPLHRISGFTGLLRQDFGGANSEAARKFEIVARQVRQMGDLIESLLALARTGRAQVRKAPLDLGQVVAELREQLAEDAGGRSIEWNVAPLPVVQADESLMRDALANLLGNALKFTRGRDPAVIDVGSDAAAARGAEVVIFVRDNGAGFDMQHAGEMFAPFHRMHSAAEFEGSGVGLANVQRIIVRHGGRIWAEAAPGAGATFRFSLPL